MDSGTPVAGPSRRRLLKFGALGAALLAVAGLGLQSTPRRAHAGELRVLTEEELAIVAAICDRLCPGGRGLPSAAEIGLAELVDSFLAVADPWTQADFKTLLRLFESAWGGLLLEGRVRTFTSLSVAEQDQTLESWRRSALTIKRTGFSALRAVIVTRYWGDPRIYGYAGYPGPPSFGRGAR